MKDDLISKISKASQEVDEAKVVDAEDVSEHSDKSLRELESEDSQPPTKVEKAQDDNSVDGDFEQARQSMIQLIADGESSLKDLMHIAQASQHPRAFEVLTNLIKTISNVNTDLLDLHKRYQDIKDEQDDGDDEEQGSTINQYYDNKQVVFHGTPAELNKYHKDQQSSEVDSDDTGNGNSDS